MVHSTKLIQLSLLRLTAFTVLFATVLPQQLLAEITIDTTNTNTEINSYQYKLESNASLPSKQLFLKRDVVINTDYSHNQTKLNSTVSTSLDVQSQQSEVSQRAVDLLTENPSEVSPAILEAQVDLDTLCRSFPLNSRCAGYQQPSNQQEQSLQRPELETRLLERLAIQSPQRSGFALGGKVSTLGVGIEGVGAISPNFNGRIGFNYLGFGDEFSENDIDYDGDLQLLNATAMLDWFPSSRSGFRLTGGLMYQNNRIDAIARSADVLDIGGIEFPLAAVGQLEGSLTLPNTIAPYIGIGYGNPVRRDRGFGFNIDLGVFFTGSPQVDLQATGATPEVILAIPGINTIVEDAIQREANQIQDDLSWLGVYPVISVGVSYQF